MRRLPLLCVVAAGALLACTKLASMDLPLVLAWGRRILEEGSIPPTNVFSWVHPGHPLLVDEWGFMVATALAERAAGMAGLVAAKLSIGGAAAGLLYALSRRHVGAWPAAGLALLGVAMLSWRLFLRAEWVSYLGLLVTLLLLPGMLRGSARHGALFLLLLVPWSASHVYWFLGPVVVLAAASAERAWRAAAFAAAGVLAAAVSPYGLANVLHPARVALDVGEAGLGESISELNLPFVGPAPFTYHHALAVALASLVAAGAWCALRSKRGGTAAALLVLLGAGLRFDRNLAMLGIAVPLLPAAGLPQALARALPWGGIAVVPVLVGTLLGAETAPWLAAERVPGFGWDGRLHPRALLRDVDPAWRDERWINDFSTGSYLAAERGSAFVTGYTPGHPNEFLAEYRRILEGEIGVAEVDARWPNDAWLLRTGERARPTRQLVLALFVHGRYAPARWDEVGTLFRRDLEPEEADARWREWLGEHYLPHARAWFLPADEALARARARHGDDAVAVLRAALLEQPWEGGFYAGLARAYEAAGDVDLAARCWRWAERLR